MPIPLPTWLPDCKIGSRIASDAAQAQQASAALAQRAAESQMEIETRKQIADQENMRRMQELEVEKAYKHSVIALQQQGLEQEKQKLALEAKHFSDSFGLEQKRAGIAEQQVGFEGRRAAVDEAKQKMESERWELMKKFKPQTMKVGEETLYSTAPGERWAQVHRTIPPMHSSTAGLTTERMLLMKDLAGWKDKAEAPFKFEDAVGEYMRSNPKISHDEARKQVRSMMDKHIGTLTSQIMALPAKYGVGAEGSEEDPIGTVKEGRGGKMYRKVAPGNTRDSWEEVDTSMPED